MNRIQSPLTAIAVLLTAILCGCSSDSREHQGSDSLSAGRGEHDRNGGEHAGEHDGAGRGEHDRDEGGHDREEGEESGIELALDEGYDRVRRGARLVLNYDAESSSFRGTVENTTNETLERVRVEVHLSNGRELGPSTPVDLAPGEKSEVELTAISSDFDAWTAHPEVGSGEHGQD